MQIHILLINVLKTHIFFIYLQRLIYVICVAMEH